MPPARIDGSCSGLKNVTSGEFAADAVQYPGKMAALGVDSIAKLARGGSKPSVTNGKSFYDTGTALVAAKPLDGITVQSPTQAATALRSGCDAGGPPRPGVAPAPREPLSP